MKDVASSSSTIEACEKSKFPESELPSTSKNIRKHEEIDLDMSRFKHSRRHGKHYVTCEPCSKYPNLVKQFLTSQNKKLPATVQDSGSLYREETVRAHLKSPYHCEAIKKHRLDSLTIPEKIKSTEIGLLISKQNEKLADKIGKLMIHVYLDAKKLTLSSYSFPARIVASDMANNFSFNSPDTSTTTMKNYDFQYLTRAFHLDALRCIVSSYQKIFFTDLLENSLAVSLRCDGSVDRMQVSIKFMF